MTSNQNATGQTLRPWARPRLVFRGTVGEVLKSGMGKLSMSGGDPGEMRCEKGGKWRRRRCK